MLRLMVGSKSNLQVATVETHWHVRHAKGTSCTQTIAFTRDLQLREPHVPTPAALESTLHPTFGRVRASPPSAMLNLVMIQDRAERTMARHYQITAKEHLEDNRQSARPREAERSRASRIRPGRVDEPQA